MGFEVPTLVVRHRDHDFEHPARPAKGQQFGGFSLCEAAELDVAERAYEGNNAIGAAGLLNWVGMDMSMTFSPTLRRWIIPVGGGLLAAVLIVIGTPHVAWYSRLVLALIAFVYIGGQSASYLWPSRSDQG
jgi:hypothetical protein